MRILPYSLCVLVHISVLGYCQVGPAQGQVIEDGSLGTSVDPVTLNITGGTTAGVNLFHSFDQFSLNFGETATFINNDMNVFNIIGRITGNMPSDIHGEIAAGGTNADFNLFLINPNGITFSDTASLDLNGSFFASTAESVVFDNGVFSTALAASTNPSLLLDVPTGLQLGANPADISAQGNLFLNPGNTLGLLGGDVNIEGAFLESREGNIEIGGVGSNSRVTFDSGFRFNYDAVTSFQDLTFSNPNDALTAITSAEGGDTNLQGRVIEIGAGYRVAVNPSGISVDGGTLTTVATDSVIIDGGDQVLPTGFLAQTDGAANAGDVVVRAPNVSIMNGGSIINSTAGSGSSGMTVIDADNELRLSGASVLGSPSGIFSQALATATASGGNIVIDAGNLVIEEGAAISAATLGSGQGGAIAINVVDQTIISGDLAANNISGIISGIFSNATETATAPSGNVIVDTRDLIIEDGAQISVSTAGSGSGGMAMITVADQLQLSGESTTGNPSGIFSETVGTAPVPGGNVTVNTGDLLIQEGARISVSTAGAGSGGTAMITVADQLQLSGESAAGNPSGIFSEVLETATTTAPGGSVTVNATDLIIEEGARISVSTAGAGSAGTATITVADQLQLSGESATGSPSGIFSEALQTATAPGGSIIINTADLVIQDGAGISVSSGGELGAGDVSITADEVLLTNQASVTGLTTSGGGANVTFEVEGNILMRFNSLISAQSLGTGGGGDIEFDVEGFILAVLSENSDVLAGSALGQDGEITGEASGIFGFREFMGVVTPDSDFTSGLDGVVDVQTQESQPQQPLPQDLATRDVAEGCSAAAVAALNEGTQSSLQAVGNGGLPAQPTSPSGSNNLWIIPVEPIEASEDNSPLPNDEGLILESPQRRTVALFCTIR